MLQQQGMVMGGLSSKDMDKSVKCCPLLSSEELVVNFSFFNASFPGFFKKKEFASPGGFFTLYLPF